ncbi:hypothetical protein GCM10010106_10040 [Thermopolyspora flexuosa]|nr:hypothetical protein GCM10010106_10040 [Thermopolyspora flexuosa]
MASSGLAMVIGFGSRAAIWPYRRAVTVGAVGKDDSRMCTGDTGWISESIGLGEEPSRTTRVMAPFQAAAKGLIEAGGPPKREV